MKTKKAELKKLSFNKKTISNFNKENLKGGSEDGQNPQFSCAEVCTANTLGDLSCTGLC